jgi:hypothetical protein
LNAAAPASESCLTIKNIVYPLVLVMPNEFEAGPRHLLPKVVKYFTPVSVPTDGVETQLQFLPLPLMSNHVVPLPG